MAKCSPKRPAGGKKTVPVRKHKRRPPRPTKK